TTTVTVVPAPTPTPSTAPTVTPVVPDQKLAQTPKQEPPKQEPPKQEPPKQQVAPTPPKQEPPKQEPPKQEPPKQVAQKDPPKQTHVADHPTKRADPPKQEPKHEEPKPRVAIAPPPPPPDQSERIESLYHDKKFSEASNIASASARANPDPDESSALKLKAQRLKALGVAYNSGMAPAAKVTEAFDQLVAAATYDQNLGGHFESEISQKLAAIAPKAALSFAGTHNYDKAHTAVLKAESLGAGGDKNIQLVKNKLEGAAQQLYQDAINDPDPKSSKDKLRQVKLMVDSKSPWFQKATSKLLGN